VSDALESARIKLKRANLHVGTAKREMFRFFKAHEQPAFGAEPNGETGSLTPGSEFSFRILFKGSTYPALPDSFSSRFGDAIHNYRCVLDHIAWQLVCHGSRPPTTLSEGEQNRVQFPCYDAETTFKKQIGSRLPGVAVTATDFVHTCHAYNGGQATNHALLSLARLSNDDKHRTVHAFASAMAGVQHEHAFTRCQPIEFIPTPVPPRLEPDTEIGTFRVLVTGHNPNVDVGLTPQLYVVLEDGRPMLWLLNLIRAQVEAILAAPQITTAL
jgi:hypothetical protein